MISGKSVILRTIRESDLAELFSLSSDYHEMGPYWPLRLPSEAEIRRNYLEHGFWQDDSGQLAIAAMDGRLVGTVGFFKPAPYHSGYELGYRIFRLNDRGKGYMSEAVTLFSSYLFALKPIPRIAVCMLKGNTPSRRVAEKCGYRYEGTMRQAVFQGGTFHDLEVFSLLRSECRPLTQVVNR